LLLNPVLWCPSSTNPWYGTLGLSGVGLLRELLKKRDNIAGPGIGLAYTTDGSVTMKLDALEPWVECESGCGHHKRVPDRGERMLESLTQGTQGVPAY
jgi:hypothetical protein